MIDSQRLESIVSEAGRIAYDLWPGAGNALDAWEKKPGDPVCEADLAVDATAVGYCSAINLSEVAE